MTDFQQHLRVAGAAGLAAVALGFPSVKAVADDSPGRVGVAQAASTTTSTGPGNPGRALWVSAAFGGGGAVGLAFSLGRRPRRRR